MDKQKDIKNFLISKMGRLTITIISAIIIFGIIFACFASNLMIVSIAVYLACTYFGWIFLERFSLTQYLRGRFGGTVVYAISKFFASCAVGALVAPFQIGNMVSKSAMEKIDENKRKAK